MGFTLEGCSVTYWPVHPFPSAAILDFSVITASLGNLCHRPPPSNKQLPPGLGLLLLAAAGAEWQGHETGLHLWKVADKGACISADKRMHACFSTPRKRRDTFLANYRCACVARSVGRSATWANLMRGVYTYILSLSVLSRTEPQFLSCGTPLINCWEEWSCRQRRKQTWHSPTCLNSTVACVYSSGGSAYPVEQ